MGKRLSLMRMGLFIRKRNNYFNKSVNQNPHNSIMGIFSFLTEKRLNELTFARPDEKKDRKYFYLPFGRAARKKLINDQCKRPEISLRQKSFV